MKIKELVIDFVKAYLCDELREYTVRETLEVLFDDLDMVKQYEIVKRYYYNISDENKANFTNKDRDEQIEQLLDDYAKAIWDSLTQYEVAELLTGTDEQVIDFFFYL